MKKYYATYLTVPVPVPVPHRPLASLFAINSGLNKPAFYSTSLPSPDKLIVNSTHNNIVFTDESNALSSKSVLLLPNSKPFFTHIEYINDGSDNDLQKMSNLMLEFNNFNKYLLNVINKLERGYYRLDFYFYIEDESSNSDQIYILEVYTQDVFNKNCFNKIYGNFGYSTIASIYIHVCDVRALYLSFILYKLILRIKEIVEYKEMNTKINGDNDTLLAIYKSNKDDFDGNSDPFEIKKPSIPGLNVTKIKRFYSTNKFNSRCKFPVNLGVGNRSRFYSTSGKKVNVNYGKNKNLLDRKLDSKALNNHSYSIVKYGHWYNYSPNKFYNAIGSEILKDELNKFFNYYMEEFEDHYFFIAFVIKFPNGHYRNCSSIQISHKNDFDKAYYALSSIFKHAYIWISVSETDEIELFDKECGLPNGNIIFQFKPAKGIEKTKYADFTTKSQLIESDRSEYTLDPKYNFKFKNFTIPATMDLMLWGDVLFSTDFTSGFYTTNVKIGKDIRKLVYLFDIKDIEYNVRVFMDNIIILEFKDTNLTMNKDLNHFKREIIEIKEESEKEEKYNKCRYEPTKYIFENGEVVFHQRSINTEFINPIKKHVVNFDNPKIITFDIETKVYEFVSNDDKSKFNYGMTPICISFYDGRKKWTYFIKDDKTVDEKIKDAFKSIMIRKYDGYRVFAHNLSNFDGNFIIDTLSMIAIVSPIIRDGKMIKLSVTYSTGGKRKHRLHFMDSLQILPNSLDKLSKSFGVVNKKSYFPILILTLPDLSLDFKGNVPNINFFPKSDSDVEDTENYLKYCNEFKNKEWCFKDELIKYCENDVVALYEILIKFQHEIYLLFNVDIIKYPTLSSLAFAIYRSNYLKDHYRIPVIKSKLYKKLKNSYYGGITEVYKPTGKDIKSYDINSLYPYAMKNFDMPVGNPNYVYGDIRKGGIKLTDVIGFFKVRVITPENLNTPIIPLKSFTKKGQRTLFPLGTWEGWYFSEELVNAMKYGYKFEIIEGYTFERGKIFIEYVDALYNIKTSVDKDDPKYFIAKLLLNSLYGRFGLCPIFETSVICSNEEGDEIIKNKDHVKVTPLKSGNVLITYIDSKEGRVKNISIGISSSIAAYSRIVMSHYIIKYADDIYYIDTDGIKIKSNLSDNEISDKEIGKMKHEYTLSEFTSLSPKVYGGIFEKPYKNKTEIVKVKGYSSKVKYSELVKCLNKNETLELKHSKWHKWLGNSTILIGDEGYTLKITESKREVIYNSDGYFIDTKPLVINN